jgi:FKBP-type peptidyl-prolyl cis-trans isomerase SlpA
MIDSDDHDRAFTLHYELRLEDGTVFDRSEESEPLHMRLGDGTLHSALERCLAGMTANTRETFHLTAERGFGPYDPEMLQTLEQSLFGDEAMLEPGAMVAFETPTGDTLAGRIVSVEAQHVLVDFNHPLAGHDFVFEVHVLACN